MIELGDVRLVYPTTVDKNHLARARYMQLKLNDRDLFLMVSPDTGIVSSFLLRNEQEPKRPGTTTTLLAASAEITRALAKHYRRPLKFQVSSINPAMIYWVSNPDLGQRIFGWDHLEVSERGKLTACKTFYP